MAAQDKTGFSGFPGFKFSSGKIHAPIKSHLKLCLTRLNLESSEHSKYVFELSWMKKDLRNQVARLTV